MKIANSPDFSLDPVSPIALTIGNFDGVHLGHQALLHRLKQVAPFSVVFTFENHPAAFLQKTTIPYLTSLAHRLSLFEKLGVDLTILSPFTHEFAQQTAFEFLKNLKIKVPFSHLILGYDAVIGSDRKSDLSDFAEVLSFSLEYLEPVVKTGHIISSREIRRCIREGNLTEAGVLLGRPYSIFAQVQHGEKKGRVLGFHTANLAVEELLLPPLGVYAVEVSIDGAIFPGVANLGYAPTIHKERPPCLEVHLIEREQDLYGKKIEVFFLKFIRPEKKFESIEALKVQIQNDISAAQMFCQK